MSDEKERSVSGQRSPSYPGYNLGRAIEMVRAAYSGAHRSEIDNLTLAQLIGFKSLSGPALGAIAALKQFGLIEGRDPKLRVTPLALSILEPLTDEERKKGLIQAARTPPAYDEVFREFGGKMPAHNVLRAIAIRRFGFSGGGADRFVAILRDSLDFLRSEGVADLDATQGEAIEVELAPVEAAARRSESIPRANDFASGDERLEFRLSPTSRAMVLFQGSVTREAIEKLSALLGMVKDTYPSEIE